MAKSIKQMSKKELFGYSEEYLKTLLAKKQISDNIVGKINIYNEKLKSLPKTQTNKVIPDNINKK